MLSLLEVCVIHAFAIGASKPSRLPYPYLRESGKVEYMLEMCSQSWVCADVWEAACFLAEKIAVWHPFVDGNKRCAWATLATVLRMDGFQLTISPDTGLDLVLRLVRHDLNYQDLAAILRNGLTENVA